MDLGIAGRKAIVCASSKGLGRACAASLAEAGCEVVVNGRNREAVELAAAEIRKATGAKVIAVAADVATPDGQKALLDACPQPDILVNNNAGPPFQDFRELDRAKMLDGIVANMVVAVLLSGTNSLFSFNERGGYTLELEAFYLFCGLSVAFLGAGRLSVARGRFS